MTSIAHAAPVVLPEVLTAFVGLAALSGLVLVYHRGWRKTAGRERWRVVSFAMGSAAVFAVLLPPVEHLAEDLVSAHMVQHVVLLLVGAPMIAVSRPGEVIVQGLSARSRKRIGHLRRVARLTPSTTLHFIRPMAVWLFYALGIWVWHAAVPYEFAAENVWAHAIEHGVFLGAGLAFWSVVLVPGRSRVTVGYRILMVFTTAFHSVLLGALLTFSDVLWYESYVESTQAMGLDPLTDQRLAGLLMWIPGGLVYTGAGLWLLTRWLKDDPDDPSIEDRRGSVPSHTGSIVGPIEERS